MKTYVVKKGDTLSAIAKEHLGDANKWQELYKANKDVIADPNVIEPGTKLRIPAAPKAAERGHFE